MPVMSRLEASEHILGQYPVCIVMLTGNSGNAFQGRKWSLRDPERKQGLFRKLPSLFRCKEESRLSLWDTNPISPAFRGPYSYEQAVEQTAQGVI